MIELHFLVFSVTFIAVMIAIILLIKNVYTKANGLPKFKNALPPPPAKVKPNYGEILQIKRSLESEFVKVKKVLEWSKSSYNLKEYNVCLTNLELLRDELEALILEVQAEKDLNKTNIIPSVNHQDRANLEKGR